MQNFEVQHDWPTRNLSNPRPCGHNILVRLDRMMKNEKHVLFEEMGLLHYAYFDKMSYKYLGEKLNRNLS